MPHFVKCQVPFNPFNSFNHLNPFNPVKLLNPVKPLKLCLVLFIFLIQSFLIFGLENMALAQHHQNHGTSPNTSSLLSTPLIFEAYGVVKSIDLMKLAIVIDHEPIPALNWDSMVMPFQVSDPRLFEFVKVGDRVRFDLEVSLENNIPGHYAIVDLEVLE
jgi:Cu/Ag efflux protein CusF